MVALDRQAGFWDRVAQDRSFTHALDAERFRLLVPETARILDVGCGYGRICDQLYRLGYTDVRGVDVSEKMIERGRVNFPHLCLDILPDTGLPYAPDCFDAVLLFAVLNCIPTDAGQSALVADIFRVLRPGGIVYISDYWMQPDTRNRRRYDQFKERYGMYGVFEIDGGGVVRHHTRQWIGTLLAGFQTIDLYDMNVTTMNGNTALGFQYIGRKL